MTFHEMHYFKQQRQSEGWKGDFFVFERKKFFNEFYIPNKSNIPHDLNIGIDYFKNNLVKYIGYRSTQKVFQTKFMDIITEDSIDYQLTTEELAKKAKLSKTTRIENKFEVFLKNKKDNQNPELLKYSSFKTKELNLDDVSAYFALQCSRTPLNLFGWFDIFIKDFPFEYNKEYALKFREFYNKQYLKFFSEKYKYLINNRNNILFVPMEIVSTNPNLKSLVSVSEHNTINLLQYKRLSPFLKKYPDELLINIDMTVVSSNLMYFCIIVPPIGKKRNIMYIKNIIKKYKEFPLAIFEDPRELSFYEPLLREVQDTWNKFSLFTSHQYLICSNQEEALNFMAEQLYYFHNNNELEGQYKVNDHIDDLLSLETLLK